MLLRFAIEPSGGPAHLIVRCDAGATWGQVLAALAETGEAGQTHVSGSPLSEDARLGHPPLIHGAIIRVGPLIGPEQASRFVLQVVSGPAAGSEFPLGAGRTIVGRGTDCDLVLKDPEASRRHVELFVAKPGPTVTLRDLGSTNGTSVDHVVIDETPRAVDPGASIRIGRTTLRLIDTQHPARADSAFPDGKGHLIVNVPPRLRHPYQPAEIRLPSDRRAIGSAARQSWTRILTPVIVAVTLALAYGTPLLIVSLVGPSAAAAGLLLEHASRHRRRRRDQVERQHEQARIAVTIDRAVAMDLKHRLQQAPDPGELLCVATRSTPGLWQRQPGDDDFGLIRIGIADLRSDVVVREPSGGARHPMIRGAPVMLSLIDHPVIGIAGPRAQVLGLARLIVAQLAILHAPHHLQLAVQHSNGSQEPLVEWAWTRWLPHAAGGSQTVAVIDNQPLPNTVPTRGAVCLADSIAALPHQCTAVVEFRPDGEVRVVTDAAVTDGVTPDLVGRDWAERCAHALAPLRVTDVSAGTQLPDTVWLADLLDVDPLDPAQVAQHWQRSDRAARAVLGMTATGPHAIDLDEDGPHILVAGMTGAGKSELLRTLITTLAINCRPDELAVLLVDYKGGAAFGDCVRLPHTTGLVTDLDNQLAARALSGLNAELRRREQAFAQVGAADLREYEMKAKTQRLPPVPRLVIVVDEFATLVDELPDLISGLVSIARRGRSLGIHLVLATQRPAGVVSGDIRANVALRIALRMADQGDSIDVIGTPDAASLRLPGRAISQSVEGRLVPFQSARIGGRVARGRVWARIVRTESWDGDEPADGRWLSLGCIAESLRATATQMKISPCDRPWPSPLPDHVRAADLPRVGEHRVAIGLVDIPDEQRQASLAIDLSAGAHWLVVGGPRCGKTTLVQTLIAEVVRRFSVADAHFYVIDAAGDLAALSELPHCGALVPGHEARRAARLLTRLGQEVDRRREAGTRLPFLVLIIDGWSAFAEAAEGIDHGRPLQTLRRLLRDGPAAGITMLVTGDRDLLTARIGVHIEHRIVLKLADQADYAAAGIAPRAAPRNAPPGRGVLAPTGHHVQIAVEPSPPGQWLDVAATPVAAQTSPGRSSLAAKSRAVPSAGGSPAPLRIDRLPQLVTFDEVLTRVPAAGERPRLWIPLGLGGDEVEPVGIDLSGRVMLIAGGRRSGRTTTLRTMASWCRRGGIQTVDVRNGTHIEPGAVAESILFLVDDAERILRTSTDEALFVLANGPARCGIAVAGLTETFARTYAGLVAQGRGGGAILLLGPPSPCDVELAGTRIDKDDRPPPGRAVLLLDGEQTELQVSRPEVAPADR